VIITGCSTGVGLSLSKILARSQGEFTYRVYATMRNLAKKDQLQAEASEYVNKNLFIRQLDVCDDSSVKNLVNDVIKTEGKIDVLVNNAGVGLSGIVESLPMALVKDNFETNFFGVHRMTCAVLPHMKSKESGRIINVTSMGGVNGVPFNEVYCATKFAVEGWTEGIAALLRNFNIFCSLIEPGPILTDFVKNATAVSQPELYSAGADAKTLQLSEQYRARMMGGFNPSYAETGDQCAEKIKATMEDPKPHLRIQTNPNFAVYAKAKLTDPTGDSIVDAVYNRFFAEKK